MGGTECSEMSGMDIVNLCSDDELGEVEVTAVKLEPDSIGAVMQQKNYANAHLTFSKTRSRRQECEENRSSNAFSTGQSSNSVLEQGQSPADDTVVSSTFSLSPAPICRQFWKAGSYSEGPASRVTLKNGKNYLHVHPMFLHSNATSHKWAFGAVAELIDNSFDEIQNGATFVIVDKTINPRDGSSALVIQDDGGGMDPEAMRRCLSFGFSDKKSKLAVGQYGNGFKTSTMRLGADVIVFSRHLNDRILTQSIGLLSYTFLTQTGHDRIVVPMVDYEYDTLSGKLEVLYGREHFMSNLSLLLQWSPYSTEEELLKQFDDIRSHGTKIIIYNLWFNDDGNLELDFDSDPEDICICGDTKKIDTRPAWRTVNEQHLANRYRYSLRAYLSILYLRVPESFRIVLRGQVVEHHNLANDLKYMQYIMYKPQSSGGVEAVVVTTIGFLKEAPQVNIHGFNVYHKNRLILPYWQVVRYSDSRGRGVVGVLEANFVEPTHNKQHFEKTSLFQKLEVRLKEMTWEYWDCHCRLIGYRPHKKPPASVALKQNRNVGDANVSLQPVALDQSPHGESYHQFTGVAKQSTPGDLRTKRKECGNLVQCENVKRQAGNRASVIDAGQSLEKQPVSEEAVNLMQENKKLLARCSEYENKEQELNLKITQLNSEIGQVNREFDRLLAKLKALNEIKEEKRVNL